MNNIEKTVTDTIEKNALDNGHITFASFSSALKSMQQDTNDRLEQFERQSDKKLNAIGLALQNSTSPHAVHAVNPIFQQNVASENEDHRITQMLYGYNGKMPHVPLTFGFPSTGAYLKTAWKLWHQGMPNFKNPDGSPAPVMPFKKIDASQRMCYHQISCVQRHMITTIRYLPWLIHEKGVLLVP